MSRTFTIMKREFGAYFATPVAYVFIVIFLLLTGVFTFYIGGLYERNQADLEPFFRFHPWLYTLLIPAISMRLWSEERKAGTLELLMTLPVSLVEAVVGKFLAAWCFTAIALALTFPMWLTINYLGNPDNTVIAAGYIGSLLLAGGYLAIGSCISALTKNQVVAFVISFVICFAFTLAGFPIVLDLFNTWAPQAIVNVISSFSFLAHFDSILKGVIDIRDVIFFGSLIAFWLYANILAIEAKKGS
jgi:ABC-2 type transport system permease protein|tara:strand:- start:2301 stop:3035 length:735 start_codon:yes stop_codon:yes gene_type:complete